jgi:hypothetical protein
MVSKEESKARQHEALVKAIELSQQKRYGDLIDEVFDNPIKAPFIAEIDRQVRPTGFKRREWIFHALESEKFTQAFIKKSPHDKNQAPFTEVLNKDKIK